jgi:hypothetical protein
MLNHLLKLLFITLCLAQTVKADSDLVITASESSIEQISLRELKNIFLRKTLVNEVGTRWIPLNLSADHPLRQAFSQKLFELAPEAMESYWNEKYFQGIMPPHVVTSEEAMLRFISSTPNAIGYILPCHLDIRVQVIMTLKVSEPIEENCNSSK